MTLTRPELADGPGALSLHHEFPEIDPTLGKIRSTQHNSRQNNFSDLVLEGSSQRSKVEE